MLHIMMRMMMRTRLVDDDGDDDHDEGDHNIDGATTMTKTETMVLGALMVLLTGRQGQGVGSR